MTEPLPLDDPRVRDLARFLESARLSDGRVFRIVPGDRVAQAILNWQADRVYDQGQWIDRVDLANTPDLGGDVEIREIGDGEAFRLCHRPTGIVVLDESRDAAWRSLKTQVRAAARQEGQ